ncbi:MAG: S9 family peptidase [Lishizhenia sp.]
MRKIISSLFLVAISLFALAQNQGITAKQLIELNRVGGIGISDDGEHVVFAVSKVNVAANSRSSKMYIIPLEGGDKKEISTVSNYIADDKISSNGSQKLMHDEVKIENVFGTDFYPNLKESNMMIYDDLNYRHWDKWEDGKYNHVFITSAEGTNPRRIDIMQDEPYDCPTQPFGGPEDYLWHPCGSKVLYVTKKKKGKEYAVSTNTDIYEYDVETGATKNLTEDNLGYDMAPAFSVDSRLAWLQMKRDGYESDKNDIVTFIEGEKVNLTALWDGTVNSFIWSEDGKKIFFNAPVNGTVQLFEIELPKAGKSPKMPVQLTEGQFDVNGIVGNVKNTVIISRRDMNHAPELYNFDLKTKEMLQLTTENSAFYNSIAMGDIKKRMVKTTDGKDMVAWVAYPPNFDPTKKYPTLLYCQGGPQGALSQFYSYRWNFQLMAAQGYIVIAPNRRGMPGYGVEWNEQISTDYGGQNMQDYLSAIDDISKESYVDTARLGCVGASYGGYSAFYLAAIHEGRFKSFIAHDGIFNWKSMYGTTEELFFVNWDLGGAYWDKDNKVAQKSYNEFNPAEHVGKWNTPILIIQGGLDFRVPIGQGLEAFQAAQLQNIKSKLLYFPEENHWVLDYQNSLIWHKEFAKWLKETL